MRRIALPVLVLMVAVAGSTDAQAPVPLPLNTTTSGALGAGGQPAVYRFTAPGAGVLTVAVHGSDDLTLAVTDEDGQEMHVRVRSVRSGGGPVPYRISVTRVP
jgi:hypothetical protein